MRRALDLKQDLTFNHYLDVAVFTEAFVTLRAHPTAPARVELVRRPLAARLSRALAALLCCWGVVPLIAWIPPHYPWVVLCLVGGAWLASRQWAGQYRVSYFAGLCPRCGAPVSMGIDRNISLPHTLTCFRCHFEPVLEVRFVARVTPPARPEHRELACVGRWERRWLADREVLVCSHCGGSCAATVATLAAATEENDCAAMLEQLTREGRSIL